MLRMLNFLRSDDVPRLARRNFIAELGHTCLFGPVVGAVEGTLASVVASKTFDAPELLTAFVFALPFFADVVNVCWSVVLRGRPRLQSLKLLVAGAAVGTFSIALNSTAWKPWAAWLFAGQVACTHLFLSGLITLRSSLWQANYPAAKRAQIAGRLQTLRMLLVLLTTAGLSVLFDRNPQYYRLVFPLIALLGLISLWPLRRLRVRGEKAELRRFRAHVARHHRPDTAHVGLVAGLKEAGAILRSDRAFASYMLAQFLLGSANFFTDPVLVNVLTRQLHFAYFESTLLLGQIPTALVLVSLPYWARMFDDVGVLRFRVRNSEFWLASCLGVTVAMALIGLEQRAMFVPAMVILLIGRVLNGLARGGGAIAWTLGHLHFAREHQAELYLGIHVALTGLRGLVMPLLGWATYVYLGWYSFAIALGLALVSHILFRRLVAADRTARLLPSLNGTGS